MASQGIDRIPDSLGYLVLTEDGAVVSSGGELENDEDTAGKITKIVYTAAKIPVTSDKRDTFKRISVVWDDSMYVITVSNHKIFASKRKYVPQDPVST
ncbi:ragulator complex protein LAMTOR4-like [Haliotis asinina]|uniref:ragulator complex protein LAMTOR4-like n=1 Tax=Haliotis asinina TaxID=109174 RepID=UPI00353184A0